MANKCEDMGFKHCWEVISSGVMYLTDPPSFPPPRRRCVNCGREEIEVIVQREIKEWQEV